MSPRTAREFAGVAAIGAVLGLGFGAVRLFERRDTPRAAIEFDAGSDAGGGEEEYERHVAQCERWGRCPNGLEPRWLRGCVCVQPAGD